MATWTSPQGFTYTTEELLGYAAMMLVAAREREQKSKAKRTYLKDNHTFNAIVEHATALKTYP